MTRDIKANYNQLTLGQLRRMCDRLLSLGDDQRVVTLPERALKGAASSSAAASNPSTGGESSGGGGEKAATATVVAMEVGEGPDGDEAGLEEPKKKKKKSKGKKNKKSSDPA